MPAAAEPIRHLVLADNYTVATKADSVDQDEKGTVSRTFRGQDLTMSWLLFGAMTGALTRISAEVRAAQKHPQQHILQLLAKRQQDSYIAGFGQGHPNSLPA